jgi:phage repressor protein C with HTH and peptisase S24 domain
MKKPVGNTAPRKGVHFDGAGMPAGTGWKNAKLQSVTDKAAYALEITGNSMLPVYRQGDTIVVSPAATIRKGDRVVVRTTDGQVMAKVLHKRTARKIELAAFNPDLPVKVIDPKNVDWMARIIWASQ